MKTNRKFFWVMSAILSASYGIGCLAGTLPSLLGINICTHEILKDYSVYVYTFVIPASILTFMFVYMRTEVVLKRYVFFVPISMPAAYLGMSSMNYAVCKCF
ncbi:MAG: hypothetical protein ACUZ8H_07100 [Candidatus Anammoxibacter sp.]